MVVQSVFNALRGECEGLSERRRDSIATGIRYAAV